MFHLTYTSIHRLANLRAYFLQTPTLRLLVWVCVILFGSCFCSTKLVLCADVEINFNETISILSTCFNKETYAINNKVWPPHLSLQSWKNIYLDFVLYNLCRPSNLLCAELDTSNVLCCCHWSNDNLSIACSLCNVTFVYSLWCQCHSQITSNICMAKCDITGNGHNYDKLLHHSIYIKRHV